MPRPASDSAEPLKEAKIESTSTFCVRLMGNIKVPPGTRGFFDVYIPDFSSKIEGTFDFLPQLFPDPSVKISPIKNVRNIMYDSNKLPVTISNNSSIELVLMKNSNMGKLVPMTTSQVDVNQSNNQNFVNTNLIEINAPMATLPPQVQNASVQLVNKSATENSEKKIRVIMVGDSHLRKLKPKLTEKLSQQFDLEIHCPAKGTISEVLNTLDEVTVCKGENPITIIIAGSDDFNNHYKTTSHFAFVNALPLGKLKEKARRTRLIYTPIFHRFDVNNVNAKIDLVNGSIQGQLMFSPELIPLQGVDNFDAGAFDSQGYHLNDLGQTMLVEAIVAALNKIVDSSKVDCTSVNAINQNRNMSTTIDQPIRILGSIHSQSLPVLIDTGSGVNIVHPDLVSEGFVRPLENLRLLTASNETFTPIGETRLTLSFKGESIELNVLVANDLPEKVILGVPFMYYCGASIDFCSSSVTLQKNISQRVTLPFLNQEKSNEYRRLESNNRYKKEFSALCGLSDAIPVNDEKCVLKIKEPIHFEALEVKTVPVYRTGKFNAGEVSIYPNPSLKRRNFDMLTKSANINATHEVLIRNNSLHKTMLYQDSSIGHVNSINVNLKGHETINVNNFPYTEDLNLLQINPELSPDDKQKVLKVLAKYHEVFLWPHDTLKGGEANYPPIKIQLEKEELVYRPPYRLSQKELDWLDCEIEKLKDMGILEDSNSPYGSPALLIPKAEAFRLVQDYRALNTMVTKKRYPLPNLEACLMAISGMKYVVHLDASHGFWQMKLDESSKKFTAFSTPSSHLQYKVLPQGFCNSPAEFQHMIDKMISGLKYTKCLAYIDDIIVFGPTIEILLSNLEAVLDRVRDFNLKLNYAKCKFAYEELSMFGYHLTKNGLEVDPSKCEGIINYERPTNVKAVRRFLGLVGYYRRFIKDASLWSKPLYELTKKDTLFQWSMAAETAFQQLKSILASPPVLAHYDPNLEVQLEVDSCKFGTGAVLSLLFDEKTTKPVCYYSQLFNKAEQNYSATEQELLGLVLACKRFRPFIYGKQVKVITDHAALRQYTTLQNDSHRLARLCLKLSNFDLDVQHRSGRVHSNCDALSRAIGNGIDTEILLLAPAVNVAQQQRADVEFDPIFRALEDPDSVTNIERRKSRQFFIDQNNVLQKKCFGPKGSDRLICVPQSLRATILRSFHDDYAAAHPGYAKTLEKVKSRFYWNTLTKDVKIWVKSCTTCQMTKPRTQRPQGLMTSTRIEPYPYRTCAIDVCGPMRRSSNGCLYIISIVCYFTKFIYAEAVRKNDAKTIGKFLFRVNCLFGPIQQLKSDCGTSLIAESVQNLLHRMGCVMRNNCAYSPKTTGQIEVQFKFIKTIIKQYVNTNQRDWDLYVPIAVAALNRHCHSSTKVSPYELLFGVRPTYPIDFCLNSQPNGVEIGERIKKMEETRKQALASIIKAQAVQKRNHNAKRRHVEFPINDEVLVFMPAIKLGLSRKLCIQYRGPYKIHKRINDSIYEINFGTEKNPKLRKIQVERLRRYVNPQRERAHLLFLLPSHRNVNKQAGNWTRYKLLKKPLSVLSADQPKVLSKQSALQQNCTQVPVFSLEARATRVTLENYTMPMAVSALVNRTPQPPPSTLSDPDTDQDVSYYEFRQIFENSKTNAEILSTTNYVARFSLALFLEEFQATQALKSRSLCDATLQQTMDQFEVPIPWIQSDQSLIRKGDKFKICVTNYPEATYYGKIRNINGTIAALELPPLFSLSYSGHDKVKVMFMLNRYPYRAAHRAIHQCTQYLTEFLFPTQPKIVSKRQGEPTIWVNSKIEKNPEQASAVRSMLHFQSIQPFILFGPPGTGKTATLVETITQLWNQSSKYPTKILACAPSNATVDAITVSLLKYIPSEHILRLYPTHRSFNSIPNEILQAKCFNKGTDNQCANLKPHQLKKPTVIITTLVGSSRLVTAGLNYGPHFSHIIVDECGQAIEPEALIPIVGLGSLTPEPTRIILAGDPYQLGPIITSAKAKILGLGISLLQRLMESPIYKPDPVSGKYNELLTVKLCRNYRSHPAIIEQSNKLFYNNELVASGPKEIINLACNSPLLPNATVPLIFHEIKGTEQYDNQSHSCSNQAEIEIVIDYLKCLLNSDPITNRKITQKDIGLMAPYKSQVNKLKQSVCKLGWPDILVGTIEEFQGLEKLITIITTVRSNSVERDRIKIGFLKDPRRFNVATTRARALLIIVGNPDVLNSNKHWAHLIQQCRQLNAWNSGGMALLN